MAIGEREFDVYVDGELSQFPFVDQLLSELDEKGFTVLFDEHSSMFLTLEQKIQAGDSGDGEKFSTAILPFKQTHIGGFSPLHSSRVQIAIVGHTKFAVVPRQQKASYPFYSFRDRN